jgi:uncharacterized protein (TIGR03437 family)
MLPKAETLATTVLLMAAYCSLAAGQALPPAILEVDVENVVQYQEDLSDPSKFGTNPEVTPTGQFKKFGVATVLGDIVAVNGQPAKGTVVARAREIGASPAPHPGQAIADITRISIREQIFEIWKADGTPVGTIMCMGLNAGPAPPGSPLAQGSANMAIVGGTGAFLGARGQYGGTKIPRGIPPRAASMAEDPARRRINGGGRVRQLLTVIPMSRPQIVTTSRGPVVKHSSDSSLVTASKPAAAGEVLSLRATHLGPTRPGIDPGQPFPASPQEVNSPVEVTVNGRPAEVLAAIGFPGAVDSYQVNFRVPTDAAKGSATIQLRAAWIAGPEVKMVIQ